MADEVAYITNRDDRWDLVAWRMCGDAHAMEVIARANPGVALTAILPPGVALRVPVLEAPAPSPAGLPPWKR